ncbi:MAG: 30S ribosomal protein S21 [Candidatus Magasanikbacteria bacterium]
MSIEVKKREGENFNSLLYRFNKKVNQSGLFQEVKSRKYHTPEPNEREKKESALHRKKKEEEIKKMKRYGEGPFSRSN